MVESEFDFQRRAMCYKKMCYICIIDIKDYDNIR